VEENKTKLANVPLQSTKNNPDKINTFADLCNKYARGAVKIRPPNGAIEY
jgi:hypothetical protein